ncbi:MAG: Gfo/Idh/MocA family oxidoreductase [Verrucomicrobiales bacterium]|nr:Gfo/Idh/MocA family oxidoreductase [Verrucomicrobiales bacterium]
MAADGDKVRLACVGVGNRGAGIISEFAATGQANIVALCDVDLGAEHTRKTLATFPAARQFQDFRKMFDAMDADLDAVAIAVPDHAHFPIAMAALTLNKHVYLEKPMTRTFYEAELLMAAARERPRLATQVGNQGHSEANYFQFKAWQEAGIISDITAITAHMNSGRLWHKLDPRMTRPPAAEPPPTTLDWDAWLSASAFRDYNRLYHYGEWRGWYDFGMGALGDWGAHILDTAHEFLQLGLPAEITPLTLTGRNDYIFPQASTLQFKFPARDAMPPLTVTWHDGVNNFPMLPKGYGAVKPDPAVPPTADGHYKPLRLNPGKILHGKNLAFRGGTHGGTLTIIPEDRARDLKASLPEIPPSPSNHYKNFLRACRGEEKTRSPFEIHGTLSQTFSLGVIAQRLNAPLMFNPVTKRITNHRVADALLTGLPPRRGWGQYYRW